MNRREALKNVAAILGGTVISSQLFFTACRTEKDKVKNTGSFTQSDIDLLDEIAETIIPETDTPGAKAAGVGNFIAMMVPDCYSEKNQKSFRQGLEEFQKNFEIKFGHSFMDAPVEERRTFLNHLDSEIYSYNETRNKNDPEHSFRIMKELVLLGYFTSEVGCTKALRYVQTPGSYEACIDYTEGERAWMTP